MEVNPSPVLSKPNVGHVASEIGCASCHQTAALFIFSLYFAELGKVRAIAQSVATEYSVGLTPALYGVTIIINTQSNVKRQELTTSV